jgi:hypothetical protein
MVFLEDFMACVSMINLMVHPQHQGFEDKLQAALTAKEWKHGPADKIISPDGRMIGIDVAGCFWKQSEQAIDPNREIIDVLNVASKGLEYEVLKLEVHAMMSVACDGGLAKAFGKIFRFGVNK